MKHRVSQGVSKGTADKWESVWTDALPYGNGRCNKEGEGRTKCLACAFLENKNNTETKQFVKIMLNFLYETVSKKQTTQTIILAFLTL